MLARNSVWMFLGYGLKILIQAGYFILIARSLGPGEYGAFVGVTALIAIVAPFAGLGTGYLLVKNVARDRSRLAECWGNSLFVSLVSGTFLFAFVMLVAHFVLPSSIALALVAMVSLSDLIIIKGADIGAQAFQACDQLRYTAKLNVLPYLLRLIGAGIVFAAWRHTSALRWGLFYLGSTVVSSAVAIALTSGKLGRPRFALQRIRPELREGLYFGMGLSAQTIYNDLDKTMLARFSTLDATGIYAAAYRIIEVAFAPVRSVLNAAYPNFFRHGQSGLRASLGYARRLLPKVIGYSLVAFFLLFVAAPLLPVFLGGEYARTVTALRWLAILPLLKSIHYFYADALTGAGHQGHRTAAQIAVAVVNVLLNLWLIPAYSWKGAAWSSTASDALLILAMYTAIRMASARQGAMQRQDERFVPVAIPPEGFVNIPSEREAEQLVPEVGN